MPAGVRGRHCEPSSGTGSGVFGDAHGKRVVRFSLDGVVSRACCIVELFFRLLMRRSASWDVVSACEVARVGTAWMQPP
jgi:hypothetical protein